MKRLWTAAGLVLVLLACALLNAWYAQRLTGSLWERLERAQALVEEERWEEAEALTRQVCEEWEGHHLYFHVVMRHTDTDQILRTFRSVLQYLKLQEMDQYAAANADLVTQLQLLAEMEQASLANVL